MAALLRLRDFARGNVFLSISLALALLSCVAVPPDSQYLEYFEMRTLMSLLCTLAVICALENIHFFTNLAEVVVRLLRTRRSLFLGLVVVILVGSMLITNDMALITFLPLAYVALCATGNERYLAFVFILMTAAANLGGMITPFGSPQNLYLYQHFEISIADFARIMWLPFALSVVLIVALCLTVRSEPSRSIDFELAFAPRRTLLYLGLFAVAIAIVLRTLPVWSGLTILLVLVLVDRSALAKVDYGLLATFVAFFLVVGNFSRIAVVDEFLTSLLADHVLLWSALGSQVVSNVPAAILFAEFTADYKELLVGVNVGGVGTIVASLASLITLRRYEHYQPGHTRSYLAKFTLINGVLLVVLVLAMQAAFAAGIV